MAAVQMNTRIDEKLKAEGDAAFAEFGYSPSEAVRLMWGFAARNRLNRRKIAEVIQQLKDPCEVDAERKAKEQLQREAEEWAASIPALVQQFFDEFGIDRSKRKPLTCEEMDDLLSEMLAEDAGRIKLGMDDDEYDVFKRNREGGTS